MVDLTKYNLVYLATVYSKHALGLECAFVDAARIAGRLVQAGVSVYSPIAHTHPIAVHSQLDPLDHGMWLRFDEAMMRVCNALVVARMMDWQTSAGIRHEIKFFEHEGKPIHFINPDTLEIF